jgi:hypothetical protein
MTKIEIIEQEKSIEELKDFIALEQRFEIRIPEALKKFLMIYEGAFVKNSCFKGEQTFKEVLYVYEREGFASIESILTGHISEGIHGFIPFAIDSGGWDFNVSINKETYGQVWVNRFGSGENVTMEYVANNFESFINELGKEIE